ncbi:PTS sugar transporter subunit IIA [Butyrivibrio sp. MC2013]|uniref:PTS sugar transporter subunit IIA n=1 Tax=Butyrivibrio sp. MC2013 TaxID=1280686 RepID=UPI000410553C|nr:PTS sugar transporter subunit IIA [Butyrivibrio sp. MC2013]
MLREFVELRHTIFTDECSDWQSALEKCVEPLVADGCVKAEYARDIINNVVKYGPYIVLSPGVAMPHAQGDNGNVLKSSISFMKCGNKVFFDDENYADLFFTIAARDPDEHLENMQKLMEILQNEELMDRLHDVESDEDILKLADEFDI